MDEAKITLRMPEELHTQLAAAARLTLSSLNSEIVRRLTQSFTVESDLTQSFTVESDLTKVLGELRRAREKLEAQAHHLIELAECMVGERDALEAELKAAQARRRVTLSMKKPRMAAATKRRGEKK